MAVLVVLVLLVLNIPAYVLIGWVIFGSVDDFGDAFGTYFRAWGMREWWEGRGLEYEWVRLRMGAFFAISLAAIAGEYKLVMWIWEKL